VTPPGRKGFGSRLIEGGLAQDLGGEVRARRLLCEVDPLDPVATFRDGLLDPGLRTVPLATHFSVT
jgi:hypothetical protein